MYLRPIHSYLAPFPRFMSSFLTAFLSLSPSPYSQGLVIHLPPLGQFAETVRFLVLFGARVLTAPPLQKACM